MTAAFPIVYGCLHAGLIVWENNCGVLIGLPSGLMELFLIIVFAFGPMCMDNPSMYLIVSLIAGLLVHGGTLMVMGSELVFRSSTMRTLAVEMLIAVLFVYFRLRLERKSFLTLLIDDVQRNIIATDKALAEDMLLNILPPTIARQLAEDPLSVKATLAPDVTVLSMDICDFTKLSSSLQSELVIGMLNSLFCGFDEAVADLCIEKVCTIGDAYIVCANTPTRYEHHCRAVCELGLRMLHIIAMFRSKSTTAKVFADINARIGIHTGSVITGIMGGQMKFKWDIWGDGLNVAQALESGGVPGALQVSDGCWSRVDMSDLETKDYKFTVRPSSVLVKVSGRDVDLRTQILTPTYQSV
eukprot:Colp12_sorted_trinity150504_noHs@9441